MAKIWDIDGSAFAKKSDIPDISEKQNKQDNGLETTNKFIVGAINEVNKEEQDLQTKYNETIGYNNTNAYWFQTRDLEGIVTGGLNKLKDYLFTKFAVRGAFTFFGGLKVFADNTTTNPYFLPFVCEGATNPSKYLIFKFSPLKSEVHLNSKLKIADLFSLQITISDKNVFDCYTGGLIGSIVRFTMDSETTNYILNQADINTDMVYGVHFGKINWEQTFLGYAPKRKEQDNE